MDFQAALLEIKTSIEELNRDLSRPAFSLELNLSPWAIKAQPLVLLDRRGYFELHDYIDKKRSSIMRPFRGLVKEMQSLVNIENTKRIIQLGGLPNEMRDSWAGMAKKYVIESVMPEHTEAAQTAAGKMMARIERTRKQDYSATSRSIAEWVQEQGGELITNLTATQMANAQAIINHQVIWNVTSPYQLAHVLRPVVGLTVPETLACSRFYSGLLEEGIGMKAAAAQLEKYAGYLHRLRGDRIARTELSNAYNFGQMESVQSARNEGLIDGEVDKSWIAGGINPCEKCLGNEDEGPIPIDQAFSSGHDRPTAHPKCECSLGYQVRR
jgi:hypothetical protein